MRMRYASMVLGAALVATPAYSADQVDYRLYKCPRTDWLDFFHCHRLLRGSATGCAERRLLIEKLIKERMLTL